MPWHESPMTKTPKILMVVGAVALMAALITVLTNPGKQKHMVAILEKSGLMEEGKGEEPYDLEGLGQMMGIAMLDRMLEVRSFLFFSTGRVMDEGESRLVTIGALGKVFFLGKEQRDEPDEEEPSESSPHGGGSFDPFAEEDNAAGSWNEASSPARFAGCSSVRLNNVFGHWVSDASECEYDGALWIDEIDGNVQMSGWEWNGEVVASLQKADRTLVQLKIQSEGEPSLMQVEIGMRSGNLVLDPVFRQVCCGDGGGDLMRCPQEVTTATHIGTVTPDVERVKEPAAPAMEKNEPQIFTIVEEMPSFPGGETALFKFLEKTMEYPPMAIDAGIKGVVYVTFVVDEEGRVNDHKVLRGIGGGCDEEAVRVVKAMPNWIPGKQRGKPVRVQYNLPIRFAEK